MDLFNESKNKYFQKVLCILNDMEKGKKYTKKEIREVFEGSDDDKLYLDFESAFLGESGIDNSYGEIDIIRKEDDCEEDSYYIPTIESPVPIRPTRLELEWLKALLKDSNVAFVMDKELIHKLEKSLADVESAYEESFWVKKNIDNTSQIEHSVELEMHLKLIRKAIIERKCIKYKSISKKGESYEKEGYPNRIKYSPRNNAYKLSLFGIEENRAIKINISSFERIEITEREIFGIEEKAEYFIERKKNMEEPIVMEVSDEVNAVERCFALFSHYHRESHFDRDREKHVMKLYYYEFDEMEIIKDILSLGSAVVVTSPQRIRDIIIERIKKALYI